MSAPWHLGAMLSFDTETTGTSAERDRIVSACVARVDGSGQKPPDVRTWLIDPQCEIPEAASDIHGITTGHAREHGEAPGPAIGDISYQVSRAAATEVPVVVFNAPFDLTLLDRETRRYKLAPFGDVAGHLFVIDPLVLDKHLDPYRKGKRTLEAACRRYGVKLDGAHDAAADAIAAARVAWRIAQAYPKIAAMEPAELRELQVKAKAEQAQSFEAYLRSQGKDEQIDPSWPMKPWEAGS